MKPDIPPQPRSRVRETCRNIPVPWYGKLVFHLLPWQRGIVMRNLCSVFADVMPQVELVRLAQACYGHFVRMIVEFLHLAITSKEGRKKMIRIENKEALMRAYDQGRGVLMLTGHFGNWEVASVAGISQFQQYRELYHFVRKPLKPQWLNHLVMRRFKGAGFGALAKRGSLDSILDLLAGKAIVVSVFDQHAGARDGVIVKFLGHEAHTFKSLAILAMSTGAPVIPAACWREPDGTHVLRFEEQLPLFDCDDTNEAIQRNTQAYNDSLEQMLLRHPEQWIWMHRRWKYF